MPDLLKGHVQVLILFVATLLFIGWFFNLSYAQWQAMMTDLDFALYDSAAYNTTQGMFMRSNAKMVSMWSEHFCPILLFVSAIYLVTDAYWPIFLFQSAMIGAAAIPLFLLSREIIKNEWAALLFALAYLANGKAQVGAIADYHLISNLPLFFFFAVWAMMRQKWGWYALFVAFILIVKEDMFVTVLSLGLFAAVAMRSPKVAMITWGVAILYAALVFLWIMPFFRDWDDYKFVSFYAWMGDGPVEIIINVLTNPVDIIRQLFGNEIRVTSWSVFSFQFALAPFFSPLGLAMLFLPSMELFLSSYSWAHGLSFHYPLLVIPIWTLAAIMGVKNIGRLAEKMSGDSTVKTRVAIIAAAIMLSGNIFLSRNEGALPYISPLGSRITSGMLQRGDMARELLAKIPENAKISAQRGLYTLLTHNPNAYLYRGDRDGNTLVRFYMGLDVADGYDMYPFTEMKIDYIAVDANPIDKNHAVYNRKDIPRLDKHKEYGRWLEKEGIIIYKRINAGEAGA